MRINQLLSEQNMSRYRLSKMSGVPQTTINDICNGKTQIGKCTAETLFKLSRALDTTMEDLLEYGQFAENKAEYRPEFETFKSNICHLLKAKGDVEFLIETIETEEIRRLFNKRWYRESLYLLAMVDYLSRINEVPLCSDYDDIRKNRLEQTIYPASIIAASVAAKDERLKEESLAASIPEFARFNIVESEVRNVF